MNIFINVILIISLVGIVYYSLWIGILIINSMRNFKYKDDSIDISDMKLYILMPMLDEVDVVDNTLNNFIKNTYNLPQIKLKIINDGSTDGTDKKISEMIQNGNYQDKIELINRTFPNAQTGKGDALNYGLEHLRENLNYSETNVIIGVLDADAIMYHDDLKKVITRFKQYTQLDLLQVKVRMHNVKNWLQRMQDIEFATVNDWIQKVRNKIHNAAASGNGQFIRLSSMDHNPWGNALLEDFEFSTNFLLEGKKTLYCEDIIVYQEAVDKYKPFIKQRSRWVQGGIDCTQKYSQRILDSQKLTFWAKFEMIFFMFLPFLTTVSGTANGIAFIYSILNLKKYWVLLLFLTVINFLLSYYMGVKYCTDSMHITWIVLLECSSMVIYNIILFPAILIAFYRKIVGKSVWIKTSHGIS